LPWDLQAIGGVTQVVIGLYDGIQQDGRMQPRVLVQDWAAVTPAEGIDPSGRSQIRFRVKGLPATGPLLPALLKHVIALPAELLRIRRLVARYRIAIINCHYIGLSDLTWIIARKLGIFRGKVILSLHGLDIRKLATLRGARRRFATWGLRAADAIVTCSHGLAAEIVEEFRLDPRHVVTIHNGVDAARVTAAAGLDGAPAPRPPGGPRLVNLGTFEHKKGHDILLRAFSQVVARQPDARLTIVGRAAESMASTTQLLADLGLARRVSIQTDVPWESALRALASADLFVLSSRNEAFSVSLLEAGALGKPVVATDVCGVAELITNGVTGLLVPTEDAPGLARAILALLADERLAADCGRRLRALVSEGFTTAETCRQYLHLATATASRLAPDGHPTLPQPDGV
jgi:glycosyltransferase involved in cell wall biosynthesis